MWTQPPRYQQDRSAWRPARDNNPIAKTGEVYYHRALALAEPRGMRPLVGHCHHGLGKLYLRTRHRPKALEHHNIAATLYREMDMNYWLEQAQAQLRSLC